MVFMRIDIEIDISFQVPLLHLWSDLCVSPDSKLIPASVE